MPGLMSRGVAEGQRVSPYVIGCPMRGCDGELYRLRDGEHLSRLTRAGWRKEPKACRCELCGHQQTLTVQVRDGGAG